MDGYSGTSFTLSAILTATAALIGPELALARWVQEKTTKHRVREEMKRSREILEFIQSYAEIATVAGSDQSAVLNRARAELAESVRTIDHLLKKREATAATPREMAWPRRLLLLYAPRSWVALFLHAANHVLAVFGLVLLVALGFNDETGEFQWTEYSRLFHSAFSPFFLVCLLFWTFLAFLLWYVTTTKDYWDKTLPIHIGQAPKSFLGQTPKNCPGLFARVLLASSIFDIVFSLTTSRIFERTVEEIASRTFALQAILNEFLKGDTWTRLFGWYSWIISILCIALAYLWSKEEFNMTEKNLWLPFPHSFRFLYSSSHWQERFSQALIALLAIYIGRRIYGFYQLLPIVDQIAQFVPEESRNAYSFGVRFGTILDILMSGVLPLYGSYRLGLISNLTKRKP